MLLWPSPCALFNAAAIVDAVKEMTRELRNAITQSGEKMAEKVEDMVVEFAGLFGATVDMSSVSAGTAENVLKAMGIQVSMSHLEVRIGDSMHLQQDRMQWIAFNVDLLRSMHRRRGRAKARTFPCPSLTSTCPSSLAR